MALKRVDKGHITITCLTQSLSNYRVALKRELINVTLHTSQCNYRMKIANEDHITCLTVEIHNGTVFLF